MRNINMTTVLGLFGLLLLANRASANGASFDITNPNSLSPPEGSYHVTVNEVGQTNEYSVLIRANAGAQTPGADAETVYVFFQKAGGGNILIANNGTNYSWKLHPDPSGPSVTWTNSVGPHSIANAFETNFDPANNLLANGQNYLLGDVFLSTGGAASVTAQLGDDVYGPWEASADLTPEASSLALLLPGLIPLGVILRKRRRRDPDSS